MSSFTSSRKVADRQKPNGFIFVLVFTAEYIEPNYETQPNPRTAPPQSARRQRCRLSYHHRELHYMTHQSQYLRRRILLDTHTLTKFTAGCTFKTRGSQFQLPLINLKYNEAFLTTER